LEASRSGDFQSPFSKMGDFKSPLLGLLHPPTKNHACVFRLLGSVLAAEKELRVKG
jgi:hypothetical protein